MSYKIVHGEVGFDIMNGDWVFAVSLPSRDAARRVIREAEKHEWALAEAAKDIAKLRESLRYNFHNQLTEAEISRLLLTEAARRPSRCEEVQMSLSEVGIAVDCTVCGRRKKPRGRSAPLEMANSLCDFECPGYDQAPEPGELWPGETREEFGF